MQLHLHLLSAPPPLSQSWAPLASCSFSELQIFPVIHQRQGVCNSAFSLSPCFKSHDLLVNGGSSEEAQTCNVQGTHAQRLNTISMLHMKWDIKEGQGNMHQRMHNYVLILLQLAAPSLLKLSRIRGQILYTRTNVSNTLAPMGSNLHNMGRCGTWSRFRLHMRRSHSCLVFSQRYHETWKSVIRCGGVTSDLCLQNQK